MIGPINWTVGQMPKVLLWWLGVSCAFVVGTKADIFYQRDPTNTLAQLEVVASALFLLVCLVGILISALGGMRRK